MRFYYEDDYDGDHYCELTPVHELGTISHYRCKFCGKLYDDDIEEEEDDVDVVDDDDMC